MSFPDSFPHEDEGDSNPEQARELQNDKETEEITNDLCLNKGGPGQGQMSREEIEESLSQIIEGIEDKRRQDLKIVEDAVKEIMAQAKRSCEALEQNMLHMHEMTSKELDEALNQLVNVLGNIKKAETELEASRASLSKLCHEIQGSFS